MRRHPNLVDNGHRRRTVTTMRLTIITLAVLTALTFSTSAKADDTTCPDGTTAIASAGGPLCVGNHFMNPPAGVVFGDPALCQWGYYQGSCAPEPSPPIDLGVAAYTYQTPDPAIAHAPAVVRPVEPIVAPVVGKIGLFRAALDHLLG